MKEMSYSEKKRILTILVGLGGAGLTAMSFCVYYLVEPRSTAALIVICIVDFLYSVFSSSMLCKLDHKDRWILKGLIISVVYFAVFLLLALLLFLIIDKFEFLTNHFLAVIYFDFFTSASLFIVIALMYVLLAFM